MTIDLHALPTHHISYSLVLSSLAPVQEGVISGYFTDAQSPINTPYQNKLISCKPYPVLNTYPSSMHCRASHSWSLTKNLDLSLLFECVEGYTTSNECPSDGKTDLLNSNKLCKKYCLLSYGYSH
jgi:hypothetical protein